MSTEAGTQVASTAVAVGQAATPDADQPYAPSWVNLLLAWMERLPGPTWLAYAGFAAVGIVGVVVSALTSGIDDFEFLANQIFWAIFLPLSLWLINYLAEVAGTALDTLRPVLEVSDAEAARLRFELTVVPARPAIIVLVASALITPVYYVVEPVAAATVGLSPLGLVLRYLAETFFGGLIVVLVYYSIRQLRAVSRIQAKAIQVNLFRPAPLYAFSILTSRTAIVIALVFILPTFATLQQMTLASWWIWAPYLAGGGLAAVAAFALPLRGIQRRIAVEKSRLQSEVGQRLEVTMEAVHRSVDGGDLAQAGELNTTFATLIAERDLVNKFPTWPWQPGTVGAVVSAIVLPIGLWFATRLLERLV